MTGSAFTATRASRQCSWLYLILPTVRHTGRFQKVDPGFIRTAPSRDRTDLPIGQLRWSPTPIPKKALTFVTGLFTMTTAGDGQAPTGIASPVLLVTKAMGGEHFFHADGEFLLVGQQNQKRICHEFRLIGIDPGEDM